MKQLRAVAIDFRWLDHLSVAQGQFRYAAELIHGLAGLRPEMRFIVLGSNAQPVKEISEVFANEKSWTYVSVPRLAGKGWLYREHAQYLRLLRKLKIDLFHALHTFVPIYPPVPVVETVHDLMQELFPEYERTVQSREYRLHRWAFPRFCSRAIAISHTTATDLIRLWHYPESQVDVVYHGVQAPDCSGPVAQEGPPIILSPYNLEPRKNLVRLLQAAAQLRDIGLPFKLVLFGRAAAEGDREPQFKAEVARLRLESFIELTGYVSDEELVKLYRTCAVFVFASLYEGFGLPLLEAMSVGARVVAHQASAMAEIVGEAGYLIDMHDVSSLAKAIQRAMNDNEIGAKGSSRAKEFSRERMARETLRVYERCLANPT